MLNVKTWLWSQFEISKIINLKQQGSNGSQASEANGVLGSAVERAHGSDGGNSLGGLGSSGGGQGGGGGRGLSNDTLTSDSEGGGLGDGDNVLTASVVLAGGDGDNSGLRAVGGVVGHSGVGGGGVPAGDNGGGRRLGHLLDADGNCSTVGEGLGVVATVGEGDDVASLGVVVWVVDVLAGPEVVVGDGVAVKREGGWGHRRARGQVGAKGTDVVVVATVAGRGDIVGEVELLTQLANEEVVEASTLVDRGERAGDGAIGGLGGEGDHLGEGDGGKGSGSESELHCDCGCVCVDGE